jgi:hypothetical protein
MRLQFTPEPTQIENRVYAPEQMIGGNAIVEIKLVEKSILLTDRWSHHRHASNQNTRLKKSHPNAWLNRLFQHPRHVWTAPCWQGLI